MKALITGITGQDGSYLTELLLSKGYEVHGIIRRASTFNTSRIDHIFVDPHEKNPRLRLHYGDVTDSEQLAYLIYNIAADEIYNLAAQSHVRVSFDTPEYTGNVVALGTIRMLEAMRKSGSKARLYQASSSEMFGNSPPPQSEDTPFRPRSPYAIAKVYAHWTTVDYREAYALFASTGILFNHESPRRGETFVTRKITKAIAAILAKKQDYLYLGNLDSKRDWGYAPEYVEAMWKILQEKKPQDYVVGTGEARSVSRFLKEAFDYVGLSYEKYVRKDRRYLRPTEATNLVANASKAKRDIGWSPKVRFKDLIKIMVDAELRGNGLTPPGEGDEFLRRFFHHKWWLVD